ncbi:aldolase/citrate lyase family protein [Lachnospiraceae bacterium 62-35]
MFKGRPNKMIQKLKEGGVALGIQIYTTCPDIVEITGYAGMDYYMLDLEHVKTHLDAIQHCLRAGDSAGITGLVRVGTNNEYEIRQVMEAGAQGVVVPHVNTKEDALRAKRAITYPPYGVAGICPAVRSTQYTVDGWDDFLEHNRKEIMLMPIIEDPIAVENIDEILSVLNPETDAIWFGRADYAQCLIKEGEKMDWVNPQIMEDFKKVMVSAKKYGISVQAVPFPACTKEVVDELISLGANIILFSLDELVYRNGCESLVKLVRQ